MDSPVVDAECLVSFTNPSPVVPPVAGFVVELRPALHLLCAVWQTHIRGWKKKCTRNEDSNFSEIPVSHVASMKITNCLPEYCAMWSDRNWPTALIALIMEAASTFETLSSFYETIRCSILEDCHLYSDFILTLKRTSSPFAKLSPSVDRFSVLMPIWTHSVPLPVRLWCYMFYCVMTLHCSVHSSFQFQLSKMQLWLGVKQKFILNLT